MSKIYNHYRMNRIKRYELEYASLELDAWKFSCAKISTFTECDPASSVGGRGFKPQPDYTIDKSFYYHLNMILIAWTID